MMNWVCLWLWHLPSPVHAFQWWDIYLPLSSSQWIPCFCFASQNGWDCKGPLKVILSNPTTSRANHGKLPRTMSMQLLKISPEWDLHNLSGSPCQCSLNCTKKQVFSDVQAEPLVFQFVPIASCFALLPHGAFSFLTELSLSWPTIRFLILFLAPVPLRRSEGEAVWMCGR